jgi:hypothetical protein
MSAAEPLDSHAKRALGFEYSWRGSMRRQFTVLGTLFVATVAIAACSDNGNVGSCSVSTLPGPQLLYPKNGALGVPDDVQTVIISGVGTASGTVILTQPGGGTIAAGPLAAAPSPLPSGAAHPGPSAVPLAAAIPNLSPATSYSVVFYANPASTCENSQATGQIGSFVTK